MRDEWFFPPDSFIQLYCDVPFKNSFRNCCFSSQRRRLRCRRTLRPECSLIYKTHGGVTWTVWWNRLKGFSTSDRAPWCNTASTQWKNWPDLAFLSYSPFFWKWNRPSDEFISLSQRRRLESSILGFLHFNMSHVQSHLNKPLNLHVSVANGRGRDLWVEHCALQPKSEIISKTKCELMHIYKLWWWWHKFIWEEEGFAFFSCFST